MREAFGPFHRGKGAGKVLVGRYRKITFSSIVSHFIVSQSSVMAQDMKLTHSIKNSYFCFLLKIHSESIMFWIGSDVGTDTQEPLRGFRKETESEREQHAKR